MNKRILIVDDDPHIRDVIRFALDDAGFETKEACNGNKAILNLAQFKAHLIVLDIGMPGLDGFQTCRAIRKNSDVPILFLTARNDEIDRVLAFELGGDDYVSKPFSPRELVLRVNAILKRGKPAANPTVTIGDLVLDHSSFGATLDGQPLQLTSREFTMLTALAKRPNQVFPKPHLMRMVYGDHIFVADRTLDSHVRNLRAKARELGCDDIVTTVHGIGLRLGKCTC